MRVLLVEDDSLHLSFLREQVIAALPEITSLHCAKSGAEAEFLARSNQVTAIVMDLRMRDRSGVDAARVIWSERKDTKILFWSNYSDEAYLRGISRIVPPESAYGYILKTAQPERLALALRTVLIEGQIVVDREVHTLNVIGLKKRENLTEVEIAILHDMAIGLSDKLLAARHAISTRTVQNRLMNIYEKLAINDSFLPLLGADPNKRSRAIATAVRLGFMSLDSLERAERDVSVWLNRLRH
jgi:DNA-binding NarL/FixJ family response regulator